MGSRKAGNVLILDMHAPWVVYQKRKNYAPWLTSTTLKIMAERDAAKANAAHLAAQGIDASDEWKQFKSLRNKVNNRRKFEENCYKEEKLSASLDSAASTWKVAKTFMNWSSNSGPPSQLEVSGTLVKRAKDVAEIMNTYFLEKVITIRNNLPKVPSCFTKCKEIMHSKRCKLSLNHVTVAKVNKLLKGLKNGKSVSFDGLDNFSVKLAADIIDKPLHYCKSQPQP